ncbi:hypothetical protein [Acetobacter conturbans]|uniref:Uncharacterized protein n=1 Tax=Acetobacter conturbans TaxID=1737472 RepID=A0ABX0JZQ3_9PROT|nr:hypothetical protein [Acetobacter conturbans]NHN88041.1 hypothetical protein [Acetobacter conturbans]
MGVNVKGGVWLVRELEDGRYESLVSDAGSEKIRFSSTEQPSILSIGGSIHDGVSFSFGGKYLICFPDGTASFSSENLGAWENLALISYETFQWFLSADKQGWFDCITEEKISFQSFRKQDALTYMDCGAFSYRLSGRPGPVIVSGEQSTQAFIFDSFQRRRNIVRYNPLVYFCVFGDDEYYQCCALALTSLRRFGLYEGDVFIVADRDSNETLSFFPEDVHRNTHIVQASDADHLFERYKIFEHRIDGYSPVLYLDTDIIISSDINGIIKKAAFQDGFHLYREAAGEADLIKVTQWDVIANWWGAWMIGREGEIGDLSFWRATSGIMLFSDLPATHRMFETVCRVGKLTRRHEIDWFGDQPVLNYVATQTEMVDIELLKDKSLNSAYVDHFMSNRARFLMHISMGVGEGKKKFPIMKELFDTLSA